MPIKSIPIQLDKKRYLRFDTNAICMLEEELDISFFKITGQNKVIEIYGDYWHRNDNPQDLINLYKQIGYDCMIFWEHEIYDYPERITIKVNNFIDN